MTLQARTEPARILYLEDDPRDVEPVRDRLQRTGIAFELSVAQNRQDFEAALAGTRFDLILSDYLLPAYDGMSAMALAKELHPEVPFILISGVLGEEQAVDCVLHGATDYVLKHHLDRLIPATLRALQAAEERRGRHFAEAALRESEERYRNIVQTAEEGIWVLDAQRRTTLVNRRLEEMLGYSAPELMGHDPEEFLSPAATSSEQAPLLRAGDSRPAPSERKFRRKNGSDVLAIVSVGVSSGAEPGFAGAVMMLTDITERKRTETIALQAQKLESVGRLAGGLAHDINNMLAVILGHVDLLTLERQSGEPSDSSLTDHLRNIATAANRSRNIIAQLLAFSRRQPIAPRLINLNSHMVRAQETLAPLIREDIQLEFTAGDDLWNIEVDPAQLDQIIMNLVINARDAMPFGGRIAMATANTELDEASCGKVSGGRPGPFVQLSVADSGTGMSPEVLTQVFEPFFTTKGMGQGTGLGLSTVFGIVTHHQGFIRVDSLAGQGTTFHVYFPKRATASTHEPSESKHEHTPPTHLSTVLLVEDDPQLRPVLGSMVQLLGYRLLLAGSPEEALACAEQPGQPIDLLLTDVVMPGMNGRELSRRIEALHPGIAMIYMSGHMDDVIAHHGILEPGVNFIAKPFTRQDLAASLQKALRP